MQCIANCYLRIPIENFLFFEYTSINSFPPQVYQGGRFVKTVKNIVFSSLFLLLAVGCSQMAKRPETPALAQTHSQNGQGQKPRCEKRRPASSDGQYYYIGSQGYRIDREALADFIQASFNHSARKREKSLNSDVYAIHSVAKIESSVGSNIIAGITLGVVKRSNYKAFFSGAYRENSQFSGYCHLDLSLAEDKVKKVHLHRCFLNYADKELKPIPHPRTSIERTLEEAGVGKVPIQCE